MSARANFVAGLTRETPVLLTTTNQTDIYTADAENYTLLGFGIVNDHSSAITVSVHWFDGTSSHLIWKGSVAANSTEIITDIPKPFDNGDKLQATAGTANQITVNAIVAIQARTSTFDQG